MTTKDNDSSEGEVVPCSLAHHHHTNHHIAEINNVVSLGGDTNGSDIESDNVSKDNEEDDDYHDKDNDNMDNSDDVLLTSQTIFCSRATNYNENEVLILARAWVHVSTDPAVGTDQKQIISGIEF
jgi:hypothetical protein